MSKVYDVILLGLGGMGSAIAAHVSSRGLRVLGIDAHEPVHDRGSSHGRSRVIRKAYFEDPRYVPMLQRTYDLWRTLETEIDEQLLYLCGVLNMGPPEHPCIAGVRRSVTEHHLPHETCDADEIARRWPAFRPDPGDIGIFEADGGFHLPETAIRMHLKIAARGDATLHWSEPVREWSASEREVRVRTGRGEYVGKHLVIAAGAWLPEIARDLKLPLKIERQVQLWWESNEVAVCHHSRMPAFIHFNGERSYYGIPSLGDEGVKIARHHGGDITTADAVDRQLRESDEADVRAFIRERVPAADGPLKSHSICLYTNTPDDHFILDRHPRHENVLIAGGFSGHGFKFTPLVGEIVADLIATGKTRQPIGLFGLKRLFEIA